MTRENATVTVERARQREERDEGLVEGYEANPNILPVFFFMPYSNLTARQRAYIFGREIKLMEIAEAKQ